MKLSNSIIQPLVAFCTLFALSLSGCYAAPLTIAAQGKSAYSIVVPKVAAVSVNEAAAEMQRDIAEATGAKLPIVKDNETITGPFISLGSTEQAKRAGVAIDKIEYDGFRIVTKSSNLFIRGIDTTAEPSGWRNFRSPGKIALHPEIPGPAFTTTGGFSNGTANGVYAFLEEQLGVRWLFPGDLGRAVPTKSTFALDDIDQTLVAPEFNFRLLYGMTASDEWQARQKMGYSANIQYGHNFETVPVELYKTHPDWFPMINGKRPQPPARNYKLETTNPELVKYFAEKAIAALKADLAMYSYSLSPSDSRGWSESPESTALYDPPTEKGAPSMTPLILKFYRDVSAIVAKEYPQGMLGGILYQDFAYPPTKGSMELPENFIPTIVGKSMGYSFYRPETRELEAKLLNEWDDIGQGDWYYNGYAIWLRESSAKITPAAPKELNFLFHAMVKAHIKGAGLQTATVWSQGALKNYVQAKMMWNPTGDAVAIQHDWLMHAYGPKAGAIMEQLYNKMDESWWSDFFRSPQSTHYNVSEAMFRNTYGVYYPQMEKLFLEAWNQPMTEKQQQRLDLIRQNMIALQFRLRNAGYLPPEYSSSLTRTPKEVFKLFTEDETKDNFSYIIVRNPTISPLKVQWNKPAASPGKLSDVPNDSQILLYPTQDGAITLKPSGVLPGSSFLSYHIQDAAGGILTRGFLANGDEVAFQAKANQPYYLTIRYAGISKATGIKWKIFIPGAAAATASFHQDGVLSLQSAEEDKAAPIYVYVPDGLRLEKTKSEQGLTVQTETDGVAKDRHMRQMRGAVRKALTNAYQEYEATEVENLWWHWQFITDPQKIGDAKGYSKPEFDDSSWKDVSTIGYWRDQGFLKYHGTAWYRKNFDLSSTQTDPLAMGNKQLLLFFGAIDGDAEIYLNGIKLADRVMVQHSIGWEQPLAFAISNAAHTGENTIAVKVTKDFAAAGIYRGVSILLGIPPAAGNG